MQARRHARRQMGGHIGKRVGERAGRQAGRHSVRQAGRQAERRAGRQVRTKPPLLEHDLRDLLGVFVPGHQLRVKGRRSGEQLNLNLAHDAVHCAPLCRRTGWEQRRPPRRLRWPRRCRTPRCSGRTCLRTTPDFREGESAVGESAVGEGAYRGSGGEREVTVAAVVAHVVGVERANHHEHVAE
jgi:hypothetical protein